MGETKFRNRRKASCETSEDVLISMLQRELDRKNEQLEVKDKQIEELNARLARCQLGIGGGATDRTGSSGTSCGNTSTEVDFWWGNARSGG